MATANLESRLFPKGLGGELDLQSVLDSDATYLSELGETDIDDVTQLVGFELVLDTTSAPSSRRTLWRVRPRRTRPNSHCRPRFVRQCFDRPGRRGSIDFFTLEPDGNYQASSGSPTRSPCPTVCTNSVSQAERSWPSTRTAPLTSLNSPTATR